VRRREGKGGSDTKEDQSAENPETPKPRPEKKQHNKLGGVGLVLIVSMFTAAIALVMSPITLSFRITRLHVNAPLAEAAAFFGDPVRVYRFNDLVSDVEVTANGSYDETNSQKISISFLHVRQSSKTLWSKGDTGAAREAVLISNPADVATSDKATIRIEQVIPQDGRTAVLELRLEHSGEGECELVAQYVALPSVRFFSGQHEREVMEATRIWLAKAVQSLESKP